ncbi:hypothetical protein [Occallatibacter riparius]|uniref:Uncharacterized protein n=1 Tax=Occallatibacter riparius TaxID=1002689 RepID=A0A9J7BP27_9BACT|nr:hypothetical protein [Occallatibacter riparius]UWZ84472.1 hypothetical protein MOP44_00720 [Occallatibacter riparius]
MSKSQAVKFGTKGFWAFDVAVGVFLKHLIDAAQESAEAKTEWLSKAISDWRVWAVIGDFGFHLDEHWSAEQRSSVISLLEKACDTVARRNCIPAEEIVSWPFVDDLRIYTRGLNEVATAPVVELGRAVIALLRDELPEGAKGEAYWPMRRDVTAR